MMEMPVALLGFEPFEDVTLEHIVLYSKGMDSPKEANRSVDSGSKQAGISPVLNTPLLSLIAKKLSRIEIKPDLRSITLVITLDKLGRPRTVIFRTESKSELSA